MKTYGDLLNRLSENYGNEFHPTQSEEIQKYLSGIKFPAKALPNLYDLITANFIPYKNTPLPLKSHIIKYLDKAFCRDTEIPFKTGELHPESPYQQLYRAQDWPVERIIKNCKAIRSKQDQVGTDKLYSWEISFLAIWESLCDVKPEHLSIAKERIIAHGEKGGVVDLSDLTIYHKPVKIKHEVKGI